MSLGGHISSADVVKGLVNVDDQHGGQFKRDRPQQRQSELAVSEGVGHGDERGLHGRDCNTEVMPPTGQVTLSATDLSAIRQWIQSGAPAPTQ